MGEILERVLSALGKALEALNEAEDYVNTFPEKVPPGTHGTLEKVAGLILDAKAATNLLRRKVSD